MLSELEKAMLVADGLVDYIKGGDGIAGDEVWRKHHSDGKYQESLIYIKGKDVSDAIQGSADELEEAHKQQIEKEALRIVRNN